MTAAPCEEEARIRGVVVGTDFSDTSQRGRGGERGTHRHRNRRLLLGSMARELLPRAPSPVLALPLHSDS